MNIPKWANDEVKVNDRLVIYANGNTEIYAVLIDDNSTECIDSYKVLFEVVYHEASLFFVFYDDYKLLSNELLNENDNLRLNLLTEIMFKKYMKAQKLIANDLNDLIKDELK